MSQFCYPSLPSPTFVCDQGHASEEDILTGVSSPTSTPPPGSEVEFRLSRVEDHHQKELSDLSGSELDDIELPSAATPSSPRRRPAAVPPLDLSAVQPAVDSSDEGSQPEVMTLQWSSIPPTAPHGEPPTTASIERAKSEVERLNKVVEELQETNAGLQRRVQQAEFQCREAQQLALNATAELLQLRRQVERLEQGASGSTSILAGSHDGGGCRMSVEESGNGVEEQEFTGGMGSKGGVDGAETVGEVAAEEEQEENVGGRRGRRWCLRVCVVGAIGLSLHITRRIALR